MIKPRIRKIHSTGSAPVYECVSVHCGKGHPKSRRFGYGRTFREAYESWRTGKVDMGDWA